ncbi:MAG TPA: hypothetical protein VKY15_04485, partial [Acidimicrobiales bacterium]|nr:hypothetical protein [Acidimicrobiales bacterium]
MPRRGVLRLAGRLGAACLGPALVLSGCASHRGPEAVPGPAPSGVPVSVAQAQPCQLLGADQLRRLGVDPTVDPTAANLPGQCTYASGAWALQVVSGAQPAWAYVTAVALAPSPKD